MEINFFNIKEERWKLENIKTVINKAPFEGTVTVSGHCDFSGMRPRTVWRVPW